MDIASQRWSSGRWIVGGALIAVGIFLLLMNMGMIDRFPLWKFWPIILMAVGVNKLLQPFHRAEGFWMLSLGVWLQVSFLRLWGYGFPDTWPFILIALGIFVMWGAFEREAKKRSLSPGTTA